MNKTLTKLLTMSACRDLQVHVFYCTGSNQLTFIPEKACGFISISILYHLLIDELEFSAAREDHRGVDYSRSTQKTKCRQ